MRLRLDLGYDGTDFHGWAAQPGLRTVQGEVETALAVLLRTPEEQDPPRLTVGGRTDAGVHARGQVAHLDVPEALADRITACRLDGLLRRTAPDIVIAAVRPAPPAFDARFGAVSRRYEYRLRSADAPRDPLTARFTADVPRSLDFDAMRQASAELLGLQDFTTFCKARAGATAVRTLLRFDWREVEGGAYAATIEADAFCHSMVRALVGAVVAVGGGRIDRPQLIELRDRRERTSRFAVMPAHGLSLEEIAYPPDDELASRAERTRARRSPLD
ncbi:tRNA pseudouridine(38-40) synthase TruA [Leucobacter soli]|uniref:tRNA pseudouridine synthase A n=1 Tax=Leucobacter soli TaxID=2812850 RepID=A0A916NGT3_9MICO|nr:tRNA pseudouridine(38-40) synthase TruA [Leucobacter soli]CAG7610110.1 tRNA pseudouridine synthase A [Leucobacter soli]